MGNNPNILRIFWKRKIAKCLILSDLAIISVGVPGLEPGKAGPESAVLPLHHTPILGDNVSANRRQKARFLLRCSLTSHEHFLKCECKGTVFSGITKTF